MKLMAMGDYYLWYCEWCDSRNLTAWSKVTKNEVCCAACHKKFPADDAHLPVGSHITQHAALPLSMNSR